MKIAEIRTLLVGKRISYYDSFSGTGACLVVNHVQNAGSSVRLVEAKDSRRGIYIRKDEVKTLISEKELVKTTTLEGCTLKETWKLI